VNAVGEIVWRQFLKYPDETASGAIWFRPTGMVISKDSSIYIYTESHVQGDRQKCIVNKFSLSGEFKWMGEYGEPDSDIFPGRFGVCLGPDSLSIAIAGIMNFASEDEDVVIYRIDSEGTINERIVIDVAESRISSKIPIVCLPDSTLAFSYNRRTNVTSSERDYIVSISKSGEVTEKMIDTAPETTEDLKLHPNGNFILVTDESDDFWLGGMRVQALTPSLDTMWSYLHNDFELPYWYAGESLALNASISGNGRILSIGSNENDIVLLCLDSNGNKLWKKEVALEDGFHQVVFAQGAWTPDGGIILNGNLTHIQDSCNFGFCSDIFLLKLDSLGCLAPGCDETTIISGTEDPTTISEEFLLVPNPSTGRVQLVYKGETVSRILGSEVIVYSILGTVVYSNILTSGVEELDLSEVPAGLYYTTVQNISGSLQTLVMLRQ
jgi:hypothetical protein